jgi:hypothetical protein
MLDFFVDHIFVVFGGRIVHWNSSKRQRNGVKSIPLIEFSAYSKSMFLMAQRLLNMLMLYSTYVMVWWWCRFEGSHCDNRFNPVGPNRCLYLVLKRQVLLCENHSESNKNTLKLLKHFQNAGLFRWPISNRRCFR